VKLPPALLNYEWKTERHRHLKIYIFSGCRKSLSRCLCCWLLSCGRRHIFFHFFLCILGAFDGAAGETVASDVAANCSYTYSMEQKNAIMVKLWWPKAVKIWNWGGLYTSSFIYSDFRCCNFAIRRIIKLLTIC